MCVGLIKAPWPWSTVKVSKYLRTAHILTGEVYSAFGRSFLQLHSLYQILTGDVMSLVLTTTTVVNVNKNQRKVFRSWLLIIAHPKTYESYWFNFVLRIESRAPFWSTRASVGQRSVAIETVENGLLLTLSYFTKDINQDKKKIGVR